MIATSTPNRRPGKPWPKPIATPISTSTNWPNCATRKTMDAFCAWRPSGFPCSRPRRIWRPGSPSPTKRNSTTRRWLARASQRLVVEFLFVGEGEPGRQMRLGREHGKPLGRHAQNASMVFRVAQFGQFVDVEIGVAIGFGHGFPSLRFGVYVAIIAAEPPHGAERTGHLQGNIFVRL